MMKEETIKKLLEQFIDTYDQERFRVIWQNQSRIFREFWKEKIIDDQSQLDIPDDLIPIVQILDVRAEGRKKSKERFEGVAYTNVFKNTWYKIFSGLKKDEEKKNILDEIFRSDNDDDVASNIDKLYESNQANKIPALTGKRGIVINAFLFAFNPEENISVVSVADRCKLIDFFKLGNSVEIDALSYGNKIVKSSQMILSFRDKYQLNIDNRGLSRFFYFNPMRNTWKTGRSLDKSKSEEISLLENKMQIILYGPPGTGKTYKTKRISIELIEND
jgi:hypothetical protein